MSDDRLNNIAFSKGVAAAERAALLKDHRPIRVTVDGLVGLDFKHLLVRGARTFGGIVNGAVFYDPIMDEVATVRPEAGAAWVSTGPLNAKDVLGSLRGRWNRVLLGVIEYASSVHDEDLKLVSNWLARRIGDAVSECLAQGVPAGQTALVKRNPDAIWLALGDAWVTQPWGIPLPPEELGGLA